jgi:hypothetical protein
MLKSDFFTGTHPIYLVLGCIHRYLQSEVWVISQLSIVGYGTFKVGGSAWGPNSGINT